MTVSTTGVSVPYAGNGATKAFAIPFSFGAAADLTVVLVNDATGAETPQTLTTHYTVAQSTNGTGTLTMVVAPPAGYTLVIDRQTPLTQPISLRNQGSYFPATIEAALDRLLRQAQDFGSRALRIRARDLAGVNPLLPGPSPSTLLGWNASGDGIENVDPTGFADTGLRPDLASTAGGKGADLVKMIQAGGGAVARTVQDKLRETVSIKDFGASTALSDNTAKIQSALDYANSIGGASVFVPPGSYGCASTLVIYSNTRVYGSGGRSIIVAASALPDTSPLFKNANQGTFTDANIAFHDMVIDGNGRGNASAPQYKFTTLCSLVRVTGLSMRNVHVRNHGYIGLTLGSVRRARISDCIFSGCGYSAGTTSNGGVAVWCSSTAGDYPQDVKFHNCEFADNNWSGLHFASQGGGVYGCTFRDNKEAHIFAPRTAGVQVCDDVEIIGNTLNGVTKKDISAHAIEVGIRRGIISGNRITNCDHGGIALSNCRDVIVSDNVISNVNKNGTTGLTSGGIDIVANWTGTEAARNINIHNNRVFDDQTVPTTRNGITLAGSGDAVQNVQIHDNDLSGYTFIVAPITIASAKWTTANCRRFNNYGTNDDRPYVATLTLTGTGSASLTGCPFNPTSATLEAVKVVTAGTNRSVAHINKTGTIAGTYSASDTSGSVASVHSLAAKIVTGNNVDQIVAAFTAFTNDGLTVNITTNTGGSAIVKAVLYP